MLDTLVSLAFRYMTPNVDMTLNRRTLNHVPVYDEDTMEKLKTEFSRLRDECYLDHVGATLYSDTQIKNVIEDLQNSLYGNPHSVGVANNITNDAIERMRYRILDHFHTSTEEYSVVFTSGATAGLKIVAETFLFSKDKTDAIESPGCFVYTQDNHTSVLGMREIVAKRGAEVICLSHEKTFEVLNQSSVVSSDSRGNGNSLFVYSAQCNFSGLKYPLRWIKDVHEGALSNVSEKPSTKWYVLLDAASFVPTNDLNLSIFKPDFVCISFYKMFGYPTGIGALLVKNSSADVLEKVYYGGGTVEVSLSSEMFHVKRKVLHQRFEDGTLPFLSIISLRYGFDMLEKITMDKISAHVLSLAKYLYHTLLRLHHSNETPVVKLYCDTDYEDRNLQGGIVTFNIMRANGEYVGYTEVANLAALFKIHFRTGCFCNPGACQRHLSLSSKEVLQNYDAGYVCGGAADLINGRPTGAVRISFGYMSTFEDVQTLLHMITKCFVEGQVIRMLPLWWEDHRNVLFEKYKKRSTKNVDKTNNHKLNKPCIESEKKNPELLINDNDISARTRTAERKGKCTLSRLFIYPIKSCAAFEITDSWILNSKGLEYDREWMIMTSSGICLTQKHQIKLCLIKPSISKEKKVMILTYPGMPPMEVPIDDPATNLTKGTMCQSRVCGHRVQGTDCGLEVSEWLSLALGQPNLKLIRQESSSQESKNLDKPELSFSSQAQYLVLNESSISWLIDKISDDSDLRKDTVLYRFRGNMILKDCEPFEETEWKEVRIGSNEFVVNGPCTRCQMICIDQTTGTKTIEPLHTLAEEFHGKLKFGIYLTRQTKEERKISIGDPVYYT